MISEQIPLCVSIKTNKRGNVRFLPLGKSGIGLIGAGAYHGSSPANVPGRWWLRDMTRAPARDTDDAVVQGQCSRHRPLSESRRRPAIRPHLVQAADQLACVEKKIARQWAIV